MLIYGDRAEPVDVRERLQAIEGLIAAPLVGAERDERLMLALLEAGELAQGLIDNEFAARGHDELTPLHLNCMELVGVVAREALTASLSKPEWMRSALSRLAGAALPARVGCKIPEGFAFYAVYPQAYALAASRCRGRSPPLVIGLRSIGTTLAAAAAAGCDGAAALTLRPCGHPFHREARTSKRFREQLAGHAGSFVVADEGPGLSGSSFAAAADLLDSLGVTPDRIAFMPSHHGAPGLHADDGRRARWLKANRLTVTFDDMGAERMLRRWFEELVGPILRIEDLSGGAWRNDGSSAAWPPAWPAQERRKFRLTTGSGVYLARFAGLGTYGEAKLGRARQLHSSGVTPEPIGLRGGFLLERWIDGRALNSTLAERPEFLSTLARYLGFRARRLPAEPWEGASLEQLCEMARENAEALGGRNLVAGLEPILMKAGALRGLRRVHIDGRLHAWEWRRSTCGAVFKTDALDHSSGHDLVGSQDIVWDIAGAASEFELTQAETMGLSDAVAAASGLPVNPVAVSVFQVCYDAFQGGYWAMAAADPDEAERAGARRDFHLQRLHRMAADEAAGERQL
jgi:hypothetical protein